MLIEWTSMEPTKDDALYQQSLLLGADVERGFTVGLECKVEVGIRSTSISRNFKYSRSA